MHPGQHFVMGLRAMKDNSGCSSEQVTEAHRDVWIGVKNEIDCHEAASRNPSKRVGNPVQAIAPAFTPVTGHEKAELAQGSLPVRSRHDPQDRICRCVPGHVNGAAHSFPAQVGRAQLGGCKQKLRQRVDPLAKALFGPRITVVVSAQTSLNVSHRNSGTTAREGAAQRARRISLNQDQVLARQCALRFERDPFGELRRVSRDAT